MWCVSRLGRSNPPLGSVCFLFPPPDLLRVAAGQLVIATWTDSLSGLYSLLDGKLLCYSYHYSLYPPSRAPHVVQQKASARFVKDERREKPVHSPRKTKHPIPVIAPPIAPFHHHLFVPFPSTRSLGDKARNTLIVCPFLYGFSGIA